MKKGLGFSWVSDNEWVLFQMEKLRPEFKSGLDALTKYILERARPKQLGSIVLTGPMLAGITQSFLDAINAGAVPTIATSWQVSRLICAC